MSGPRTVLAAHLAVCGVLAGTAGGAGARTLKGPSIGIEQSAPSEISERHEDGSDGTGVAVAARRIDANLLVPIPVDVFGAMLVVKADFARETRAYSFVNEDEGDEAELDAIDKTPDDAGMGVVVLPHAKEGAPRFFVVAERYGPLSWARKARPMAEFVLGVDMDDEDLPFALKFSQADQTESRLLVRYRQFPGFIRWLYLAAHRIETASGWYLDLSYPTHALGGWQTQDRAWRVYGGARAVGREYSVALTTVDDAGAALAPEDRPRGWYDGYGAAAFLAVRREIVRPLYVALETGVRKEVIDLHAEDGEILSRWETKWSPWARVALETWVKNP